MHSRHPYILKQQSPENTQTSVLKTAANNLPRWINKVFGTQFRESYRARNTLEEFRRGKMSKCH